jgi:hypothetical protein
MVLGRPLMREVKCLLCKLMTALKIFYKKTLV